MSIFPSYKHEEDFSKPVFSPVGGMELRDYFAAQALPEVIRITMQLSEKTTGKPETWASNMAYEMADAMMEARKQ